MANLGKKVRLATDEGFFEHLKLIKEEASKMQQWQRTTLRDSFKASNETSRLIGKNPASKANEASGQMLTTESLGQDGGVVY